MRHRAWLAALLIALVVPLLGKPGFGQAVSVRLEGQFVQGGIILGTTDPAARVSLDGRAVRVAPSGRFVFGFGRDAPGQAVLEVVLPDGARDERRLTVEKRAYRVQRIDGLPSKMVTPPDEVLARIRAEAARIADARATDRPEALFESGFVWPVIGPISGVFGSQRILNGEPRRPHYGVDVAVPTGTPVVAPADGVVTVADADLYFTGGTVLLDHGHGLTTVYSHLNEVLVAEGQVLRQGDVLGTVARPVAHLDWRVNWFEERLDPEFLVPPMPKEAAKTQ